MKKIIVLIISFFVLSVNTYALEINSKNVILYNLNDNKVIYEVNSKEEISVASLTKIMTTLIALENIEDINDQVKITYSMINGLIEQDLNVVGLKTNQVVLYKDLLYGTFVASGADAARALAISVSGSEEEFVRLMNKKVEDMNLKHTHFENITGLDEANHYSSVEDISIILLEALKNKTFSKIFYTDKYTFSTGNIKITSTFGDYLDDYNLSADFVIGAKTGYTDEAGKCLASVGYDKTNDIRYLLVTAKANTTIKHAYHVEDAINIYNYYFENYKYHTVIDEKTVLAKIETKYSNTNPLKVRLEEEVKYYLKNDYNIKDFEFVYEGDIIVTPFTKKGEPLGSVNVYYKGEVIDKIDLVLNNKISFSLIEFVKDELLIISIIIIIVFLVVKFIRKKVRRKKYKKRISI